MNFSIDKTDISLKKPTAITIGTFDGVHIGHRKIIEQLVNSAKKQGLESTILTFFPHPRMVLQQNVELKLINSIEERIQILKSTGIDNLIVYPFTKEFSRLGAQEYIEEILVKKLCAHRVIIGYDHHFGRNRTADIHDLKKFGERYHFEVEEIPEQDIENVSVSSTKVRKALQDGELEKANRYLGAPFLLTGTVERGRQLGQQLGYPTANLSIKESYKLIPKPGIYVVKSTLKGKEYYGMMSIGTNPTVGGVKQTIETHFFDWSDSLYGEKIQIQLLKRIRDEEKFATKEELIEEMKRDEAFSRNFIRSQNL